MLNLELVLNIIISMKLSILKCPIYNSEGNFDYVIVGDYASVEDYVVYRDHPEHQRIIAEMIKPHVAKRAAVQYLTG